MIYAIRCGDFVKIGHCRGDDMTTVRQRLAQMQTGCPHVLELVGVNLEGDSKTEKEWHTTLDDFRLRGEWFYLGRTVIAMINWSMSHVGEDGEISPGEMDFTLEKVVRT